MSKQQAKQPENSARTGKKALIAMSGGVDSSVAALVMQEAGYDCTGATMKLLGDAPSGSCCSLDDSEDARAVCARLDMPYYVFDFTADFRSKVIKDFISEYRSGRTPNPCIVCNRSLKFEKLLARALLNGFDCLATGHYARILFDENSERWQLAKGRDRNKDQSYVLYTLTQKQLAHLQLPLGEYCKPEVRALASGLGLVTAEKPESQDICFVPDGNYAAWLLRQDPGLACPGEIVDEAGHKLGIHSGIIHYTVGQRRGIGIASDRPYYVKAINRDDNSIIVCQEESLFQQHVRLDRINLISVDEIKGTLKLTAKHRYRSQEAPVRVEQTDSDEITVTFLSPEKALTPGQALVLYEGDLVFGGGTIVDVS